MVFTLISLPYLYSLILAVSYESLNSPETVSKFGIRFYEQMYKEEENDRFRKKETKGEKKKRRKRERKKNREQLFPTKLLKDNQE